MKNMRNIEKRCTVGLKKMGALDGYYMNSNGEIYTAFFNGDYNKLLKHTGITPLLDRLKTIVEDNPEYDNITINIIAK